MQTLLLVTDSYHKHVYPQHYPSHLDPNLSTSVAEGGSQAPVCPNERKVNVWHYQQHVLTTLKKAKVIPAGTIKAMGIHWKRPWFWERLKPGEGDNRGRDGWMASLTQWTWIWHGDSKGQGSLACCSPWGHKELDTTEWLNNNNNGHLGKKNRPLVLSAFESQFRAWTMEPDWWDSNLPPPTHPVILGKLPLGSVSSSVCVYTFAGADTGTHAHVCSVVSDSFRPHGLLPTRLLCPWDFPGKNTGVG